MTAIRTAALMALATFVGALVGWSIADWWIERQPYWAHAGDDWDAPDYVDPSWI